MQNRQIYPNECGPIIANRSAFVVFRFIQSASAFPFGKDKCHDGADDKDDADYGADGEDFAKQKNSEHDACYGFKSTEYGNGHRAYALY